MATRTMPLPSHWRRVLALSGAKMMNRAPWGPKHIQQQFWSLAAGEMLIADDLKIYDSQAYLHVRRVSCGREGWVVSSKVRPYSTPAGEQGGDEQLPFETTSSNVPTSSILIAVGIGVGLLWFILKK